MAKPASIKIRLNSTADTGFFYVTKKTARTNTEKMVLKNYDPVIPKHVEFKEGKIKSDLAAPGPARRPERSDHLYHAWRRHAASRALAAPDLRRALCRRRQDLLGQGRPPRQDRGQQEGRHDPRRLRRAVG